MDLGNPMETIVYYLLIGRMTCLGHRDEVPVVRALVCIVTHLIRPTVNHDVRLLNYHDSPCYYVAWTLNLEKILSMR